MNFNQSKSDKKGEVVGYITAYFISTTVLFFLLSFLQKLPGTWNYVHIMGITLFISIVGGGLTTYLN